MTTNKIINPATGRPFNEVNPNQDIQRLRKQIVRQLARVQGKYDAAQTTSQNELHWQWADELSPHAANTLAVRKKLRSRSRYEVANNGYLMGIVLSLCQDFVCSGPTLQITDPRFSEQQKRIIEKAWLRRADKIKLRRKLWQLRRAKIVDGEAFAFRIRWSRRPQVDYRIIECDQVTHYSWNMDSSNGRVEVDGLRINKQTGEPEKYHLLNEHPGETEIFNMQPLEGRWIDADQVIHWFRRDRPFLRGIPETIASLPLWALLRRYTLAVVQNAEIAADFTALLESQQLAYQTGFPSSGTPAEPTEDESNWFDSFPIDRGLMTVLPEGYQLKQLKPEQPVTLYDTFVAALVQEAARCMMTPRNLALGYSGNANMSASTVDRQFYKGAINEERQSAKEDVLDPDLEKWWFEAVRVPNYFEDEIIDPGSFQKITRQFQSLRSEPPDHVYRWDEIPEHTDPVKVAQAIDILHKGHHLSDIDIQEGRFNRRVEDHYENLERQQQRREEIGIVVSMDDITPVQAEEEEEE